MCLPLLVLSGSGWLAITDYLITLSDWGSSFTYGFDRYTQKNDEFRYEDWILEKDIFWAHDQVKLPLENYHFVSNGIAYKSNSDDVFVTELDK